MEPVSEKLTPKPPPKMPDYLNSNLKNNLEKSMELLRQRRMSQLKADSVIGGLTDVQVIYTNYVKAGPGSWPIYGDLLGLFHNGTPKNSHDSQILRLRIGLYYFMAFYFSFNLLLSTKLI